MAKKVTFLILFLLIAFFFPASSAFAQTYEIYTYGSGNFLVGVFNGIKMIVSGGYITSLIKVLLIVGLLAGVLGPALHFVRRGTGGYGFYGGESFLEMIKTALMAGVAVYVLLTPKADIAIVDRCDPSQSDVVTDVPLVNVYIAHVSSMIGDVIGKQIEDVVTPVDAVRFRKNGVAIGAKYLNEVLDVEPPAAPSEYGGDNDVSISMVLNEYWERCVFPNLGYVPGSGSQEATALSLLHKSPDLLQDIPAVGSKFKDPNTYFNVNFDQSNPLTCETAPNAIYSQWSGIFDSWIKSVNWKVLGNNVDDPGYLATVQELFSRYFPQSVGSFQDQIMQLADLNAVRYALISYAAKAGDNSLKDTLMMQKTGSGWLEVGRLFNKLVQTMRMLFEALIYGLSVFLPVFFAIAGVGALITFMKINFWLQMWVPFYVLLNAFADWQFARVINDTLYNPQIDNQFYGVSFATVEAVRSHANLILGYIGAFTWSIPPLAWGIVKGGEYAITHAMQSITAGSGGQEIARSVGAEVGGAGNVSMGNQTMANVGFMSSTRLGSGGVMMQGLMTASAIGGEVGVFGSGVSTLHRTGTAQAFEGITGIRGKEKEMGFLGGGDIREAAERKAGGVAVGTAKGVGGAEVYGGDYGRAMGVGGIGEGRAMADMETFKSVADKYGGVDAFARAVSTKDYGTAGAMLGDYGDRKGLSPLESAFQIGGLMGNRQSREVSALENAFGVIGKGGFEFTETQKILNEAARMEQMSRIASGLGLAKGGGDFKGMYEAHQARHAEDSWTIPNQGVAERLNHMAADQGLGTRFSVGDRVRMAWTPEPEGEVGGLTLARGEAGASREALDLSKEASGVQRWSGRRAEREDLTTEARGFRGQDLNLATMSGVVGAGQPGMFNPANLVPALKQLGPGGREAIQFLTENMGQGKDVSLNATMDPQTKRIAAFELSSGGRSLAYDLRTAEAGVQTVRRDESISTFRRGPETTPDAMWSAAIAGDRSFGQRVFDAPTAKSRDQEMQQQAMKFSQAQGQRLSKEGVLVSRAEYSAKGSVEGGIKFWKLIGVRGGAEAGISGANVEQENYNRIYRDIRRAQDSLLGKLNSGELKNEEFIGQYTKTFQDFATEADRLVREKGDEKFGASGLVTRPFGIEIGSKKK
jgi:hypothetical protein